MMRSTRSRACGRSRATRRPFASCRRRRWRQRRIELSMRVAELERIGGRTGSGRLCQAERGSSVRRTATAGGARRISLKACIQSPVSSLEPAPRSLVTQVGGLNISSSAEIGALKVCRRGHTYVVPSEIAVVLDVVGSETKAGGRSSGKNPTAGLPGLRRPQLPRRSWHLCTSISSIDVVLLVGRGS
jgi:hypothetical protein